MERDPAHACFDTDALVRRLLDAVVTVVGPDFRGVVGGSPDMPLLCHAAWVGDPAVVARLLDAGADPTARADADFASPLAVAALGSQHHASPGRDYVATAQRLLAAGVGEVEPLLADVAEGPLRAWLSARR